MRRRDVLRAGAGAFALTTVGGAAAHPESHFLPFGSVDIDDAKEAVVGPDGEVAYVAAGDGFATVDVSDTADPQLLAEVREPLADRSDQSVGQLWDCRLDGDRLIVVGPANPSVQATNGVLLYDVSDPAEPEFLSFTPTEFPIHNAEFVDGNVFLTGNTLRSKSLVILEVVGDELSQVGRWSPLDHDATVADIDPGLRPLHDVQVRDGLAALAYWDIGTWLVDVSDPATPSYVARVGDYELGELTQLDSAQAGTERTIPPGNAHYCEFGDEGTLLGVGKEAWAIGTGDDAVGGPGGIDLYDVSDPAAPEHLAHVEAPRAENNTREGQFTTSHNFDIANGRLYSSWYFGGVQIHDLSDPSTPMRIAWWRDAEEASFWTAQLARAGDCVVASSAEETSPQLAEQGRLYTFPDGPVDDDELPDGVDGTDGNSDSGGSNESGSGDSPLSGFGVGAAALGLGAGALARARSDDGDEE
ncbi:LVIVD repeat-containing protein [Natronoarchaeum mannanilyticum]|uniref:LVIVD repeat-containing protein n=1 Tax=Natronoarchaeum mannanilyticum TaxID=926360 RepID=A0AAV3T6J0_9EURY